MIVDILGLDQDLALQTCRESCAIGELDMHLRAVCTIFVDGDEAHDFVAEFFTMNHSFPFLSECDLPSRPAWV